MSRFADFRLPKFERYSFFQPDTILLMLCLERILLVFLISGAVGSPLTTAGAPPPGQFHGRAQPSSLWINFFERALGLLHETVRLLGEEENRVGYCMEGGTRRILKWNYASHLRSSMKDFPAG